MLPATVVSFGVRWDGPPLRIYILEGLNESIAARQLEKGRQDLGARQPNATREFVIVDFRFQCDLETEYSVIERLGFFLIGHDEIEVMKSVKHERWFLCRLYHEPSS